MSIAKSLLPEFEAETAGTRKVLERVKESEFSFKPDEKSWSLRELSAHLPELLAWVDSTLSQESFDVAPVDGPAYSRPEYGTLDEILKVFDERVEQSKKLIADTSDADFMKEWALKSGGDVLFAMPRVVVFRSFIMNHMIHHRGQLTVYLRMTGSKLPQLYGPTADEPDM